MTLDQNISVNRGVVFYRAVDPQPWNDMDAAEEGCLEKRGAPSIDVYQPCCADSFCLLSFFHRQRRGSAAYHKHEQPSAASGQFDSACKHSGL